MTHCFFIGFKNGMNAFGQHVGRVVNTTLLFFVYILAVGPTFFIAKLTQKHFLKLSLDKDTETYWENLNLSKKSIEKYYKQF
ncbi:MAG: hypothetical protein WCW47_02290 [Candidatus Paceibacterota bacterium]|jgi:hypothetical protein